MPEHWLLLRSITLWPKPKQNATLCILGHVVRYTIQSHLSLMIRYSDFLRRFRCKIYLWHNRRSTMRNSRRCSVAAASSGAGVSTGQKLSGETVNCREFSLGVSNAVSFKEIPMVNDRHQPCRITLWYVAE
jgi:hypothetical protein